MAFLFVHFREKDTPDGEQVHFGLSRDGFCWKAVNDGKPVLWAYYGDKGVRDFTVVRSRLDGRIRILATDLSLAYGLRNQYHGSWDEIRRNGSKYLSLWESKDLVHWTQQRLVRIVPDDYGVAWAPDVIWDESTGSYLVHWSSTRPEDGYRGLSIYCSHTQDFVHYEEPRLLYTRGNAEHSVIDSAMVMENGRYYLFVKSENNPAGVMLLTADSITGPFTNIPAFEESMEAAGVDGAHNEAPAVLHLPDGRWCLFLDYFGAKGSGQGYRPFLTKDLSRGSFMRADADFYFPYRFKHGAILEIADEEYARILRVQTWSE